MVMFNWFKFYPQGLNAGMRQPGAKRSERSDTQAMRATMANRYHTIVLALLSVVSRIKT
jgi:hypothetical protein